MTLDEFLLLQIKTIENGQILVEIEPNTWVDFESYKPSIPEEVTNEQV